MNEPGKTTSVLWVDEDRRLLRAAESTLRRGGIKVTFAETVEEALDTLTRHGRFDVIVLDAIVPLLSRRTRPSERPQPPWAATGQPVEANGRVFQEQSERLELAGSKTIMVSFVHPDRLERIGYRFEGYVMKLGLPEAVERLRELILEVAP